MIEPIAVPTPIRRAFADLLVGQVHYASCGSADAPAVLLLHQSPRSWLEYRAVLPLLAPHCRAIAMDTVGFGDSAAGDAVVAPAQGIAQWASVAVQLLDALGIERAHVVGHHTGGVIAIEMAANFGARVASLVLSSTPFTDAAFRQARATRPPIDHVEPSADGSHLTELWQRRQGFYPPHRPDLLQAFVLDALKVADAEHGHRVVAAYRMEDVIGRVRQPVRILCATDDPFSAPHAAELLRHLPQARVVSIEGAMVPLPDQMSEAFARAVLAFIAEQPHVH